MAAELDFPPQSQNFLLTWTFFAGPWPTASGRKQREQVEVRRETHRRLSGQRATLRSTKARVHPFPNLTINTPNIEDAILDPKTSFCALSKQISPSRDG